MNGMEPGIHKVTGTELSNCVGVRGGYMSLDECAEDAIVTSPNVVGVKSGQGIRTRERAS